ncbi:YmdB family metallophosphoesterase [Patescibacteria group bacterium]|nr:YmdB family metallophosphoesterase [Patescibacteria group bacterium]
MKILFIGDVVGKAGRLAVAEALPKWKKEHSPDLIIANPENSAHGHGATPATLDELMKAGVEAFTYGDHLEDHQLEKLADYPLVRPANLKGKYPGAGVRVVETALHKKVLLISLLGFAFVKRDATDYFDAADAILKQQDDPALEAIFIDFHAETTTEKAALAHHLDGQVSALVGTHTHVPTADTRILPNGTAFQSDVGMSGTEESVIGFHPPSSKKWLKNEMGTFKGDVPFDLSEARPYICDAVVIDTIDRHKSHSIERITTRQ